MKLRWKTLRYGDKIPDLWWDKQIDVLHNNKKVRVELVNSQVPLFKTEDNRFINPMNDNCMLWRPVYSPIEVIKERLANVPKNKIHS